MIKKVSLLALILLTANSLSQANEYPVKVKPAEKISTSDVCLKEGKFIDFVVVDDVLTPKIKLVKGQKITGLVTSVVPNDFWVQPASIYVENFKAKDSHNNLIKVNGVVYKKGNDHHNYTDFVILNFIRGGEVQIMPEADTFILYVED